MHLRFKFTFSQNKNSIKKISFGKSIKEYKVVFLVGSVGKGDTTDFLFGLMLCHNRKYSRV